VRVREHLRARFRLQECYLGQDSIFDRDLQ
jgi:hypothetical protein